MVFCCAEAFRGEGLVLRLRPGIGFRPPSKDIRQPAQSNIYNRLPAKSRDIARPPSAFERPKTSTSRPNNVYADRNGDVYRRTKEGQWQQRDAGRWKPSDGGATVKPGATGPATRPSTGKQPSVTTKPNVSRPAPRPDLERDFSARQRGDDRMRERSSQQNNRGNVSKPAPQSQARPAPQARSAPASPKGGGGDKDKRR